MSYSELQELVIEKYQTLNSLNNKLLTNLIQKNKIDLELNLLQLQRQSLLDEIKELEEKKLNEFKTEIKDITEKKEPKKLKDKSNISMQPIIEYE